MYVYVRGPTMCVFWSRPTYSDVLYTGLDPFGELGFWTHLGYWSGPTWGTGLDLLGVLVGTRLECWVWTHLVKWSDPHWYKSC